MIEKFIKNITASILCGFKGFLTFNLALLSYLEYSLHNLILQEKKGNKYAIFKKGAILAMQRNTIPFLEVAVIMVMPAYLGFHTSYLDLLQSTLICAVVMILTCFVVRTFNLNEKFVKKTTNYSKEQIDEQFSKNSIMYPIFSKNNKQVTYNSPEQLSSEVNSISYLAAFLALPLKVGQIFIMLPLAVLEFLDAIISIFLDMFYDRSFESMKSSLQRSGHLLYASARNIIPISTFDECISELIGFPRLTCSIKNHKKNQ